MRVYEKLDRLIGSTPLLELESIEKAHDLKAKLLAKLEGFNPAGSVKDRAALYMLDAAERSGELERGTVIIEPTSGSTGIALAALGASRGYSVIIVMPDTASAERRRLIAAYGARLVLTPGELGMKGCIEKAAQLKSTLPKAYIPNQFSNAYNAEAHYASTGPEIWADTEGKVDILVAGVGTGGTITGAAGYLKERSASVRIVAVEPDTSPLLSRGYAGGHGIQGIGANLVPDILDRAVIDEIVTVSTENAYYMGREVCRREGILVGPSSGAAIYAAMRLASSEENRGRNIVAIAPDSGERYLSTDLYKEVM